MGKQVYFTADYEAKIDFLKSASPNFNLSKLVRDAIDSEFAKYNTDPATNMQREIEESRKVLEVYNKELAKKMEMLETYKKNKANKESRDAEAELNKKQEELNKRLQTLKDIFDYRDINNLVKEEQRTQWIKEFSENSIPLHIFLESKGFAVKGKELVKLIKHGTIPTL